MRRRRRRRRRRRTNYTHWRIKIIFVIRELFIATHFSCSSLSSFQAKENKDVDKETEKGDRCTGVASLLPKEQE
jgi:hypothetical protein